MNDLSSTHTREALEAELRAAGSTIKGKVVKCPFHDDQHPSGSMFEVNGHWKFRCFPCNYTGDALDIRARIQNKPLADVVREENAINQPPPQKRPERVFETIEAIRESVSSYLKVETIYVYSNPETHAPEMIQVRCLKDDGKKTFISYHHNGHGFIAKAPPKPWPLYNRARIVGSKTIVVVEGEKCVHSLHEIGIIATTSPGGSSNAENADWSPLAGKEIFIWRDLDDPGAEYARDAVAILERLEPKPTIWMLAVESLGLPVGGDCIDFLESGGTAQDVWTILKDGSELVGSGTELEARLHELTTGKWRSIAWPWGLVSRMAKSLFPATITCICGDPGSSKSFWVMQAMQFWHETGTKVSLYELEEDRAYHLHRLLALLSGVWDILNDDWCRANPEIVATIRDAHAKEIDSFSPRLFSAPLGQLRYREVLEWIEQECAAGCEVIAIDPITAIEVGDSRQTEDLSFIVKSSAILRKYRARMILVTHPRNAMQRTTRTMDDLAGGRAFSRNTQSVFWLHNHTPSKKFQCSFPVGVRTMECNRSLTICKARNGPGQGAQIAFHQGATVGFMEQGLVVGEQDES